ncbi:MAG: hypothetical protein AAF821_24985 [Cyanobacteria bacterium P01_D01_bin.156]
MQRPIGVTILALIDGTVALLFGFVGGTALFAGSQFIEQLRLDPELADLIDQLPPDFPSTFFKVLAAIFLVIALANAAMAFGLWTLRAWAWYVNLGLQGLGIFGNLGGLILINPVSILSIAFSGFYIYYFLRQPVQAAFGVRNAF